MVLVAVVGTGGLRPALAAIEAGKDLAVASKEILVMAGEIVMREAREKGVHVLPVDSEHNAIFQCLEGKRSTLNAQRSTSNAESLALDVGRWTFLICAASFSPHPAVLSANCLTNSLRALPPEQALKHPTWNMGPKITIDSATLFNKGPRNDRGALAFWRGNEARRSRDSSAEHCAFDGGIRRRLGPRAVVAFQHVLSDSVRRDVAGPGAEHFAAARFRKIVEARVRRAALRRFSRAQSRAARRRNGRHSPCCFERRQ